MEYLFYGTIYLLAGFAFTVFDRLFLDKPEDTGDNHGWPLYQYILETASWPLIIIIYVGFFLSDTRI